MKPITCTRRIQFCAGHRVVGHENKCRNLHGHNYVAYIEAQADELDSVGRVIDFSVLKEKIGGWIDEAWDHGLVLWIDDPLVARLTPLPGWGERLPGADKLMMLPFNPTAENMARYLGEVVCPSALAGTGVRVTSVTLLETENCYATWRAE